MRVNPVRLQQAMDHAGINQTMLADIMGVRMETISRYMNGHNEPQKRNLCRMAHVLHVDPEYLTSENANIPTSDDSLLNVIVNIQEHAGEWTRKQKMGLIKLLCDYSG